MSVICHFTNANTLMGMESVIQITAGFNAGKAQELKDRHRVNIDDESGMI